MFAGLDNATLYSAKRITAKFLLRDQSTTTRMGTAFFVMNYASQICLVTNRHILDAGYGKPAGDFIDAQLMAVSVEGFAAANEDINALPTARNEITLSLNSSILTFAAEYHEDIACFVNPKVIVPPDASSTISFFIKAVELADDNWIENKLSICDFLALPGFSPWHDKRDMRPILRTGTISSDPRTNYSDSPSYKGRRVAYEGFSFGGSSGSPVFATQKGLKGDGVITISGFREGKLVGINVGHFPADYQCIRGYHTL